MKKFFRCFSHKDLAIPLRAKTYSYLIDGRNKDEKAKGTKKCVIKRELKFENDKNYLEATHFENKINHLEKIKIDIVSLVTKENKEFIRNKLILKNTAKI